MVRMLHFPGTFLGQHSPEQCHGAVSLTLALNGSLLGGGDHMRETSQGRETRLRPVTVLLRGAGIPLPISPRVTAAVWWEARLSPPNSACLAFYLFSFLQNWPGSPASGFPQGLVACVLQIFGCL